jgi:WD40 repeat protein
MLIASQHLLNVKAPLGDAESGLPLTEAMRHNDPVNSAQFSPSGRRIVTASDDGSARVWDSSTGNPLTEPMQHEMKVIIAQFSPAGDQVATIAGGQIRFWKFDPENLAPPTWLLELAEAISGQVVNDRGVLEPTRRNSVEVFATTREELDRKTSNDSWSSWGRWFLGEGPK